MWLKLTEKYHNRFQLTNMDMVQCINEHEGVTTLYYINDTDIEVTESLAEIELMLKGSKSSAPDPRERNVIGGQYRENSYDGLSSDYP